MDVTPLNSTVGLTQLQFSPVSYFSRAQQNKACRRVLPAVLCPWWGVTPASCFTCVRYPIIEPLMSSLLKSKQTKTKQITKSTAYINSNPNLYCNCQPTYLRLSAGWRKEKSFLLELVRLPVILSWLARVCEPKLCWEKSSIERLKSESRSIVSDSLQPLGL